MDVELFDKLMERGPDQHPPEWQVFLELCDVYLRGRNIEKPIIVELGTYKNNQKKFYEKLFGAEHIGVDRHTNSSSPDVLGDTHDPRTLARLRKKLDGRMANILFIDACHCYRDVKRDFEMYSPLCTDIIAFHDVDRDRYQSNGNSGVWKFWDEMKGNKEYGDFLFLSIYQNKGVDDRQMGIGVLVKNV